MIFLNFISFFLQNNIENKELYGIDLFLPIIFFFILDRIVFNHKIYPHHIFSMVINVFVILIIIYILNSENHSLYVYIYVFLTSYSYSFYTLLIKMLNINYNINIFLIASLIGLMEMIYHLGYINEVMNDISKINIFSFLFLIFINFIYYFLYYYIIWKLGPIQSSISVVIGYVIIFFLDLDSSDFLLFFTAILLSIFSAFLYLNIIELKFWGLNKFHILSRKENKKKINGENLEIYHDFNEEN